MNSENRSGLKERRLEVATRSRQRLVAHIAAGGTTDMADAAMENDSSAYCDPQRDQREKSRLFRQSPIVACFSSDVASAGDAFVFDLLGTSVLLLRSSDSRLRGYLNRCSHRGTRLIATRYGACRLESGRITCPFHAWSYDIEGKLSHVPGAEGFEQQLLEQRNLTPVQVREHLGLVFVQIQGQIEDGGIAAFFGDFHDEIAQLELSLLQPVHNFALDARSNWKYAMDTYCEGYHFSVLHRDSIGRDFFSNIAVFDDFGRHWRLCFAERALAALVDRDQSEWPDVAFSGIHFLFPNTLLVVGTLPQGEMCVRMFQLLPGQDAGSMTCLIRVYAPASVVADEERLSREFAYNDANSDITQEDYEVAVEGYRNLANAPDSFRLVYGRNEPALQAFHRALASALSEP